MTLSDATDRRVFFGVEEALAFSELGFVAMILGFGPAARLTYSVSFVAGSKGYFFE